MIVRYNEKMKPVGFAFNEIFLRHAPPRWHPDQPERLDAIIAELKRSGLWTQLSHIAPRKATDNDILRVHAPSYLQKIMSFGIGQIEDETWLSEQSVEAAFFAAGSALEAIDQIQHHVFRRAFCAVRPPGHHAEKERAMGFCIFNNAAIAARYAQCIGMKKIFIIDFDVHHGNGTQQIFEEDNSVYYFSTHQARLYPETGSESERGSNDGKGFTYNVEMPAGAGDREYLTVYNDLLPSLVKNFFPDLVLVSAGYDIHIDDPIASMRVTNEGIRALVAAIIGSTYAPIIFLLEGGYQPQALADSVRVTIREMLR